LKEISADHAFRILEWYCDTGIKLSLIASLNGASAKWHAQVKEITSEKTVRLRLFDDLEFLDDLHCAVSLAKAKFWHTDSPSDEVHGQKCASILRIGVENGDSFLLCEHPIPAV
jgi:hypothetical protein